MIEPVRVSPTYTTRDFNILNGTAGVRIVAVDGVARFVELHRHGKEVSLQIEEAHAVVAIIVQEIGEGSAQLDSPTVPGVHPHHD